MYPSFECILPLKSVLLRYLMGLSFSTVLVVVSLSAAISGSSFGTLLEFLMKFVSVARLLTGL